MISFVISNGIHKVLLHLYITSLSFKLRVDNNMKVYIFIFMKIRKQSIQLHNESLSYIVGFFNCIYLHLIYKIL